MILLKPIKQEGYDSPDTIHPTANAGLLYKFAMQHNVVFGDDFLKLFRDCET